MVLLFSERLLGSRRAELDDLAHGAPCALLVARRDGVDDAAVALGKIGNQLRIVGGRTETKRDGQCGFVARMKGLREVSAIAM